ncbi:MFS transporter [Amycolatopsis sp. RM579]|uniref:MFS transporter n=1 Tax=Amycolatopsis pithecellobii TaxID=664692 RepID=A0A6N7YJG9_9PSEU|nr:MFS transporter [Amycolatopsis pithecellobii]MTD53055.1 MFS transporter [Amycolatopsis pithecellobii]
MSIRTHSALPWGHIRTGKNSPGLCSFSKPRSARSQARAIGLWSSGTFIGLFIGLSAGGWLDQTYGRRVAMWAAAVPGVIVAILLKFTGTERKPRRPPCVTW